MTVPLIEQSAGSLAAALRARTLTAEALARACLDRIAEREPVVQAWTTLDPDKVLAQARALDTGPWQGPLHGLPVAHQGHRRHL